MKQTIIIFGGLAIGLLILFQLTKYSLVGQELNRDIFIALSGLTFIIIGFVLSRFFQKSKKASDDKVVDEKALKKIGLSEREHEILGLMAKGQSNREIANTLFIAETTVKTHVSNVLMKLNAKRRTQAIQIGRDLNII